VAEGYRDENLAASDVATSERPLSGDSFPGLIDRSWPIEEVQLFAANPRRRITQPRLSGDAGLWLCREAPQHAYFERMNTSS
jgi:hypothetical protein